MTALCESPSPLRFKGALWAFTKNEETIGVSSSPTTVGARPRRPARPPRAVPGPVRPVRSSPISWSRSSWSGVTAIGEELTPTRVLGGGERRGAAGAVRSLVRRRLILRRDRAAPGRQQKHDLRPRVAHGPAGEPRCRWRTRRKNAAAASHKMLWRGAEFPADAPRHFGNPLKSQTGRFVSDRDLWKIKPLAGAKGAAVHAAENLSD